MNISSLYLVSEVFASILTICQALVLSLISSNSRLSPLQTVFPATDKDKKDKQKKKSSRTLWKAPTKKTSKCSTPTLPLYTSPPPTPIKGTSISKLKEMNGWKWSQWTNDGTRLRQFGLIVNNSKSTDIFMNLNNKIVYLTYIYTGIFSIIHFSFVNYIQMVRSHSAITNIKFNIWTLLVQIPIMYQDCCS